MNNYRVEGESREVGAIGICEKFIENVVTESSHEAYNQVIASQYSKNREHVYIKEIQLMGEYGGTIVEPRAYIH